MEVMFKLIKYLNNKYIIFLICLIFFIISEKIITPRQTISPNWLYNLDSAFYYIIFFAIGYLLYPYISDLFTLNTQCKKFIFIVTILISFSYSALLFIGIDCISFILEPITFFNMFVPIIRPLILIWFNLCIAKLLENISLFNEVGMNSIYLCCNEFIAKTILPCFFSIFGIGVNPSIALESYIYTILLLFLNMKFIIPLEKQTISSVKNAFNWQ